MTPTLWTSADSERTDAPHRVQRKRIKGWRMPENTVYVGRPTKWGNPYKISGKPGDFGYATNSAIVLNNYENYIKYHVTFDPDFPAESFSELRGKNLACFCPLDQPCHADILLRLANERS